MSLDITIPGLTIICGLQGAGKSFALKYIIYQNRKRFDWGIVFSNTGFSESNFDYVDRRFIHSQYNEKALVSLKNLHARLIKEGKKPSAFVIFDDCLFGSQWRNEPFLNLMTQLRHYNITCIISCQYPQGVPPSIRTNVFQVLIFAMPSQPALKALYESYGQMFDSYNEFKQYVMQNTGSYQFVFYNARSTNATIEGKYSVMKCPAEIPRFKLKTTDKM